MFIYIAELFLGILLCYLLQYKCTKNRSKKILFILLILMLSFVGGFRGLNIGTDVSVYGEKYFNLAVNSSSFSSYFKIFSFAEYGYLLVNYIVSRFTSNINIFLFVLQLMCNTLVLLTLKRYQEKSPLWMSYTAYFCFFYGMTFNIMRQSCALAIIFFAIKYLEEKKWIKYFIMVYLAFVFHSTAIIAGVLIFLIFIICNIKHNIKKLIIYLMIIMLLFSIFFIKDIIGLFYHFGIITERIYNYIFIYLNENINISWGESIFRIIFMIFVLLTSINNIEKINFNYFLMISMITEFILFQLKTVISYADRFSFYFGYMNLLLFSQCFNILTIKVNSKRINKALFIILCLSYFIYKYIILGSCEIYPYNFNF